MNTINRRVMVFTVKRALKIFSLDDLEKIERLINVGQMMDVFEEAVDKAIESKRADNWQQENT